jgi:tetratricopeptide (TPR) repeat protein
MKTRRTLPLVGALVAAAAFATAADPADARHFSWTTRSAEAKQLLKELQARIESFQFGPATVEVAQRIVAADPGFAMGHYYLAATQGVSGQLEYEKAAALAKNASEGERRFIEAMGGIRNVQTASDPRIAEAIGLLEALARDYPNERLVHVVLGQLYQGQNQPARAHAAFERCEEIGPSSPRVRSFLANDDLLKGDYARARATFEQVEAALPKGAAPFSVRYGIAFSYLYEGKPDAALQSLESYLAEYRAAGLNQGFPEVFIWNSIARIELENGRPEAAMKAYEKGYESVPGSSLPDDQKEIWKGRLLHGECRTLAKLGKHDEAWAKAQQVKKMIEEGGEEGKQFWPAYHYLAGYLKLEAGDVPAAIEQLEQANPDDPFHTLLLARAYERAGRSADAKKAYERVVASPANGLERALAFPEARRKLASLAS